VNAGGLFPIQNAQMSFGSQVLLDPLQKLQHYPRPPSHGWGGGGNRGREEDGVREEKKVIEKAEQMYFKSWLR